MSQYWNFCVRRFLQTTAIRRAAQAGHGEDHTGKIFKNIFFFCEKYCA